MENKQTAMKVLMEWMIEESQVIPVDPGDVYQKAKELLAMEKEQIINARDSYTDQMSKITFDLIIYGESKFKELTSEEYYNETYKQQDK
jgi:hypothetical protein